MVTPITMTLFLPILSASLPATGLPAEAKTKIIENRLPASISERESDWLTSGSEIPSVATIIAGMRFASGAMKMAGR